MIPARVSETIATFFLLAALAGPPLSFGQQAVVKEEHVNL